MANFNSKDDKVLNRLLKTEKLIIPFLTQGSSGPGPGPGPAQPNQGSLQNYSTVAGSTITNVGFSVLSAKQALSPGNSITGFPPGTDTGEDVANAAAAQAQLDLTALYNDLAARIPTQNLTGQDLGTLTLGPGVYKFNTSAQLTGTLVLDGGGAANSVFIFQIGSTLTTASASAVSLIGSANAGNVFWQIGSSATLGTTTAFAGNICAQASITANTGASVNGALYARVGAVTLDDNAITNSAQNTTPPSPPVLSSLTNDEESLLFFDTEDLNQATFANGAFSSLEEQNDITFVTPNNVAGQFSLLLRINEQIEKVLCAEIIQRNGSESINLTFAAGSNQGITSNGDKIVLNADSGINLASFLYDACLVVRYTVKQ